MKDDLQKREPCLPREAWLLAESGQFADKVSADMHTLLHDEERVRIESKDDLPQIRFFELGNAHAQHAQIAARIGTLALPVGKTAAKARHNIARQLGIRVLGKDQHLIADALLV